MSDRILLVEDEFLIRLTLSEALADAGFDVLEAEDADSALALLTSDPTIRLLMTDIQLPGSCNGRVLVERARALNPDLPVIFMSGRPDLQDATRRHARDRYIAKPYLPSEVCLVAQELLGGGRGQPSA